MRNMQNCEHCQPNSKLLLTTTAATAGTTLFNNFTMKSLKNIPKSSPAGGLMTDDAAVTALAINTTDMIKSMRYPSAGSTAATTTTTSTTAMPATTTTTTPTGVASLPLTTIIPPSPALCQHLLQPTLQNPQRCSSVGSTTSSICETVSSDSGLAMSPTEPQHYQMQLQHQQSQHHLTTTSPLYQQQLLQHHHHQHQHHLAALSSPTMTSTKTSRSLVPSNASAASGLAASRVTQPQPQQPTLGLIPGSNIPPASAAAATASLLALAPPPIQPLALPSTPSALSGAAAPPPTQQQQQQQTTTSLPPAPAAAAAAAPTLPPLVGGLGAAAMAANLAESFSLLRQQANHFQELFYAAQILGRGYYQPAGPLISPHVIQPVTAGPPPPPSSLPPNVPLLATTNTKVKSQTQSATVVDGGEHLPAPGQPNASPAEGGDSELLLTGGDLAPYRYPPQSGNSSAAAAAAAAHHNQQQQQQQHQLHQQAAAHAAAAAAAAAAAHQSPPYPRSMHAQMHYAPAYPASYYSPYPGEPMCYSPPAYQPYFPTTKVYQSAPPPPPHHSAYRRYPYYQPGHPPPPSDLYEQGPPPPPPNSAGSTGGQVAGPPPPPSQAGQPPPPPPPGGTQLVPAGPPAGHSQHLEHYAGPQGYYAGYGTGSSAAGQCYTRSIQAPYMEYPPQCPCPMQQSCPKNVHTGPHIGSNSSSSNNNSNIVNNSSSSNYNSNNNVNHSLNGSSSNNNTSYNHHSGSNNNSTSTVASMSNNHCSSNNNNSNTLNVLSLQQQQQQQQHNNKSQTNDSTMTNNNNNNSNRLNNNTPNANNNNAVNTNRGPVKNIPNPMEPIPTNPNKIPLLTIAVKTELAVDDTDNKSQYEENVVTPLTPPDCYSTNEDKLRDTIDTDHMADIQDQDQVIDKTANSAEMEVTSHLRGIAAQVQPIEAYDLTTSTPPLANGVNASVPIVGATNSPHMNTVGRKARIGKSMARNMVYAANQVSSTNPPGVQQPPPPVGIQSRNGSQPASPLHSSNTSSQATTTPLPKTSVTQKVTTPEHNGLGKIAASPSPAHYLVHNVMTKQEIDEVHAPLLLKAEIKSEKIKLEDEQLIDTMLLQQQQHVAAAPQQALSQQSASQKHIIQEKEELKVIKAEPITLCEILHESKVKVELDCEIITPHEERKVAPNCSMGEGASKSQGRMRLLSSRHCLPATARSPLPAVNCDIDLSTTSDDEVLDLCHSPVAPKCSGKRRGILEINKNQCKKSPPNSYKSLIKQAEPKTYLCLSRKFEKKSRFGRIHCSKSPKGSAALNNGIRRRELMLTDQQKESLRNRKKKLAAMEKRRRETKEQRRAELRQKRRKEAKEASNQPDIKGEEEPDREEQAIKKEEAEEDEVVNLVEDEVEMLEIQKPQPQLLANNNEAKSSPQITPKPSPKRGKPAKKPAIPLHLMETIDAVARGYFSEPECRTSSSLVTTTTTTTTCSPSPHKSSHMANESKAGRSPLAHKIHKKSKTTSEKRSKSETKKPLKVQNAINSEPLNVRTVFDAVPSLTATTSKSAALANTTHMTASDPSIEYLDQNRCKSAEPKQTTKSAKEGKSKKSKVEQKSSKKSKSKERHSMENNSMDCVAEPISSAAMETNNNEIPKEAQILNGEPPEDTKSDETAEQAVDGTKEMVIELDGEQHNVSSVVTLNAQNTPELPDAGADADLPSTTEHTSVTEHSNGNSSTTSTTPTPQQQQQQQLFIQPTLPPMPRVVCHHHGVKRNRSRSKFGNRKRQKLKHSTVSFELDETLPPATRNDVVPKWNNGWTWEGEQFQGAVFLNSDDPLVIRTCYPAMRHVEGDIIRTRDCVLLKANEDNELPYVAKVAHLWENPEDGEMMMSLLWYYRPEHTEQGRQPSDSPDEVYASRHRDHNSVACIEDKCYVLTFSEYCRYRRRLRAAEEDIEDVNIVPKRPNYYSIRVVPENTNPELVMFCRRAYEFRTRRLLKMPNKQDYYVVNS